MSGRGRGRGRGPWREAPVAHHLPPVPPRGSHDRDPPPTPPAASKPADVPSPRVPVKITIQDPIPFGLEVAGLERLEVLSTEYVTAEEIAWLDLDSARCSGDARSVLGLAPAFFDDGHALLGISISTATRTLFVDCAAWRAAPSIATESLDLLRRHIFTSASVLCVGFDFGLVAINIRQWLSDVTGVDVSSAVAGDAGKLPAAIAQKIFGTRGLLNLPKLWVYNSDRGNEADHGATHTSLRAWLARACACHSSRWNSMLKAKELDTRRIGFEQVRFFSQAQFINNRLEALKPKFTKAEFTTATTNSKGETEIKNAKFSTKLRPDAGQYLRLTSSDGTCISNGSVDKTLGKSTSIKTRTGIGTDTEIVEIEVVGRASGTLADERWKAYLQGALDGSLGVYDSEHNTRILWAGTRRQRSRRTARPEQDDKLPVSPAADRLNPSQRQAHDAIVAPHLPGSTLLITGPPGTGKTSVISASASTWLLRNTSPNSCIYCVTASNVAAKNIAESLLSSGFIEFRLIVSSDYLVDWHEHRYQLGKNLVVSSHLSPTLKPDEMNELMGGVRVVICTLAMLSSTNLVTNGFFSTFVLHTLLVDEASQIRIDQYPHVLDRFRRSLQRVAFFGDANQLAPYNSGQVKEIRSVFDLPHLQCDAFFLDTQYRMPKRMGEFISKHVYNSRLKSASTVSEDEGCIKFIDVSSGAEERSGTSTTNAREVEVVVELVQLYYNETRFKILTPYDAQRGEIEAKLKAASLPWEDRVFNVDSFQGQEDDIIIISIVKRLIWAS